MIQFWCIITCVCDIPSELGNGFYFIVQSWLHEIAVVGGRTRRGVGEFRQWNASKDNLEES